MEENGVLWNPQILHVLNNIRTNSAFLSQYHKKKYFKYKGYAKYFKIPIIILSGINSVTSVGMQIYIQQDIISGITCIISLVCAIITSIELYLGIQRTMENELLASKEFYLLSIDIYKTQALAPSDRLVNARAYLEDKFKTYCKLIENNELLYKRVQDSLQPVTVPTQQDTIAHTLIPVFRQLSFSDDQNSNSTSTSTNN